MKAHSWDMDDRSLFVVRQGVGVRRSTDHRSTYELVVVAGEVGDLVRSAGGWLCDRVRAGWQVSVVVPEGADVLPLRILGAGTFYYDDPYDVLKGSSPAAVAIAADVVAGDPRLGNFIERALECRTIEVTVWGSRIPARFAHHFDGVRHAASDAARAFKPYAVAASGSSGAETDYVEEFHSVALWYPPDGTDLVPVG